jgi:hypothetical protein
VPVTDRPRLGFRRRSAKISVIRRTGVPFTISKDLRERIAPPGLPHRPLAHAANTFSPDWGECLSRALQASRCGHPRVRDERIRECERLLNPLDCRAWN